MDLFLCWLVAPVGLLVTVVGLSLLVERLFEIALPWAVRPALGLAVAIVLAQFGTATATTAKLTLAGILVLAVVGLLVGHGVPGRWPGRSETGVAAVVFLLFASPFLVIGEATWAGYIKLDDTATWMALTDHIFEYGRGVGHLAPSTHQQVIVDYLGGSYPIGGFVPAGLMSKISGQDVAFTIQPSMAFAAAVLALLLFDLTRRLVRGLGMAAGIAIFSSLSSLLLGYYLWGGAKELVTAALIPLAPALAGFAARSGWPRRVWGVFGLAVAAVVVVLGPGGAVWVIPTLIPAAVLLWRDRGRLAFWRLLWPSAAFSLVLILPAVVTPNGLFNPLIDSSLTEASALGNLDGPLNILQIAGIWPAIDFRLGPHLEPAVLVLAGLCLAIALGTVVACLRLRDHEGLPVAAYVAGGAVGAAAIMLVGSPWVDGKAMATLSPGLLAAALLGIVMVGQRSGFRLEAAVVGTLVVGTVAWSAFLAYQGIWFAPRAPFVELEGIGKRFAGEGPALSTEVANYGPRHFLRKLDDEGASDRRHRPILLTTGSEPIDGQAVDLDEIRPDELDPYNLLVVRRSPAASRAPASFGLAYAGKYYDVWQRQGSPGALVEHLSLGDKLDAGAVPSCADVGRLAEEAGTDGSLIAARVDNPIVVDFTAASKPSGWTLPTSYTVAPSGSGKLSGSVTLPGGEYELWLGGSVFGNLDLSLDGSRVASERALTANEGIMEPLGSVSLGPGDHKLELDYTGASLYPGSASPSEGIGPLVFEKPEQGDLGTVSVAPSEYRQLCGHRWDWIEAYD
jgi:hypothetical protein